MSNRQVQEHEARRALETFDAMIGESGEKPRVDAMLCALAQYEARRPETDKAPLEEELEMVWQARNIIHNSEPPLVSTMRIKRGLEAFLRRMGFQKAKDL